MKIITDTGSDILEIEAKAMGVDLVPISANFEDVILEKNNFINILVVVTRYFGGILLGTGGLVKAYSEATQKVIEKSEIVIEEEGIELEIELNYKDLENFKYYCNKNNINIIDVKYSDLATCLIEANFVEKENITSNTNLSIQKYKIIRKNI